MNQVTHLIFNYHKNAEQAGWSKDQKKANRVSVEKEIDFATGVPGASDKVKAMILGIIRTEGQRYFNVYVVARFRNGEHKTLLRQTETSYYA